MTVKDYSDSHNVLWFILGFAIPIVGIIAGVIMLVIQKSRRQNAKACFWGAGISMLGALLINLVPGLFF